MVLALIGKCGAEQLGNGAITGRKMNLSAPFIARPVTTTLLTLAIVAAGALGFSKLPVSLMPQVDFPTIVVNAQLPGASPPRSSQPVSPSRSNAISGRLRPSRR